MKLKNIFAAGLMASMAFVACNKETTTENGDTSFKSVTINLANLVTKSTAESEDIINEGASVSMNNFQVFFADDQGKFYTPKQTDGQTTAPTYFVKAGNTNNEEGGTGSTRAGEETQGTIASDGKYQFHFLDPSVTKVYVIGNKDKVDYADFSALKSAINEITIENEQDVNNLTLYGMGEITGPSESSDAHNTEYVNNKYYTAEVTLNPLVSRIQITSVEYAETAGISPTRAYASIKFSQFALNNFYSSTTLSEDGKKVEPVAQDNSGNEVDAFNNNNGTAIDGSSVWNYLDGLNTSANSAWYNDNVNSVMEFELKNDNNYKNETKKLVYNFFPAAYGESGSEQYLPQIIARFVGTASNGTATPLYLATSKYTATDSNQTIDASVAKVYNVSFKFNDNNIGTPIKCVELTVNVANWTIVNVTPEF